jgi:hypothetical protein
MKLCDKCLKALEESVVDGKLIIEDKYAGTINDLLRGEKIISKGIATLAYMRTRDKGIESRDRRRNLDKTTSEYI